MRLLKFDDGGHLFFSRDYTDRIPPCGILSHRWGKPVCKKVGIAYVTTTTTTQLSSLATLQAIPIPFFRVYATTMVALRPITPTDDKEASDKPNKPTPVKEKVRTATKFCQDKGINISQKAIFEWANVSERTGWRMIAKDSEPRRHHNSPYATENRGRKPLISQEDFEWLEDRILQGGFDLRICTWFDVFNEVFPDKEVSDDTLRRAFNQRGYHKCVACQKPYLTAYSIE